MAAASDLPGPATAVQEAERRQLTVMFCDLVGSTELSSTVDPEELRDVVRAYQAATAAAIGRFDGHIAQYLGDGVLAYFGYPHAHEDDAERAVRAALEIVETVGRLSTELERDRGIRLAVRVAAHTGPVVVGDVGAGARHEQLALGETPNIAARLQSLTQPNTVAISGATRRLVHEIVTFRDLGPQTIRGAAAPVHVYEVLGANPSWADHDTTGRSGLTPLVGREQEVAWLLERWEQVEEGLGQVVVLSGEPGIGKSRLSQIIKARVAADRPHVLLEGRCSPYFEHTPFYPVIDLLQRAADWRWDHSDEEKLERLERLLHQRGLPLSETVPLMAALLSLPLPDRYTPLTLPPERQKQKTLEAVLALCLAMASDRPVLLMLENVHWSDPSSLEFMSLLVAQAPAVRLFAVLTARPEFHPPWSPRSHLTHLMLNRLTRKQTERMARLVAGDRALPPGLIEHVTSKTDGVPLFVEELTKTVLEAGLESFRGLDGAVASPATLAIPVTLQDALMARLDRLGPVKEVAQWAATVGRAVPYEVLRAVSPLDETRLQHALGRLVETELLYQRGSPPQAVFIFKHALIQEAAYQSLLKRTRQQYHRRIAEVLADQFRHIVETQPELLGYHCTEAGLGAQAVVYWRQAGQRAFERSANLEAISHFTAALQALKTLPETIETAQHELFVQIGLGHALTATRGYAAPGVEQAYGRARELCQRLGERVQASVLFGLWFFYHVRATFDHALPLAEQLLSFARREDDRLLEIHAHWALGGDLFHLGELQQAQAHLDEGSALYGALPHRPDLGRFPQDPGVTCRGYGRPLWLLGYPDQAVQRGREAITLARTLAHPFSLAFALNWTATVHQFRGEAAAVQEHAAVLIDLAREQGFAIWVAFGGVLRGWALAQQGRRDEGMRELRDGMEAWRATGAEVDRPYFLALLAEASAIGGDVDEGLAMLAEALDLAHRYRDVYWEPELHRLKGQLLLQRSGAATAEADACYRQALDAARRQAARSLELRAAMSLSRLWTARGEREHARSLLAEVYAKFTEGFETADLVNARSLLAEVSAMGPSSGNVSR
jgi:class 3 adenylate cyclase/predicted ATPase